MQYVLRVDVPEQPEQVLSISPMDRGHLVHRTLDRFLREVLERPHSERPKPDEPWTDTDRSRLREIALEECAGYEARGLTGKAIFWERDRRAILRNLDLFLTEDDSSRADERRELLASEMAFGFADADFPPLAVELSDGRVLRFRGSADRVDVTDDGDLVVIDYKTGSKRPYLHLSEDDPDRAGSRLQLPIYGRAARVAADRPDGDVWAGYWFITEKEHFAWEGYELTKVVDERFDEVLRIIVDGIESGHFPQRPPEPTWRPWVECGVLRSRWARHAGSLARVGTQADGAGARPLSSSRLPGGDRCLSSSSSTLAPTRATNQPGRRSARASTRRCS